MQGRWGEAKGLAERETKQSRLFMVAQKKEGKKTLRHYIAALNPESDGLLTFEKAGFTRMAANFQLHNKT